MKKQLLFILLSLFVTIFSYAQVNNNAIFLGGDIGASSQKTKNNTGTTVNKLNSVFVSPVFGKAVKDNLVVGGDVSFSSSKDEYTLYNVRDEKALGAGIFARKYKTLGKSNFLLFLQGRLGYAYTKTESYISTPYVTTSKRHNIGVNVYPGISYALSRKLQLETGLNNLLSLNYFTEKSNTAQPVPVIARTNGINISSSIDNFSSLYIGFRVLIN